MRALSIAIVSGIFPPDHGGPATYVPEIARELVRRGHRVEVICLSDRTDEGPRFPFPVRRIERGRFKPLRAALTVLEVLRAARRADVVFVNGLELESWVAAAAAGKPAVHKVVGDSAWERARNRGWFDGTLDEYQAARKPIGLRFLDWLRSSPLRRARSIVVPSEYLRGIVAGWNVGGIAVVRNAVAREVTPSDHAGGVELPPFAGRTIVTIARLVAWKGLEALVRIVAANPTWRLVIVGDGPLRAALESQARASAIDRVVLTGAVSHSTALSLLRRADLFVLNSSYEGLPHVVLEAMNEGIPIVATRVGGTPELVLDRVSGLLVSPDAEEELRRAIREILEDRDLAEQLVASARNRIAAEFGFAKMVDETERILRSVVPGADA